MTGVTPLLFVTMMSALFLRSSWATSMCLLNDSITIFMRILIKITIASEISIGRESEGRELTAISWICG